MAKEELVKSNFNERMQKQISKFEVVDKHEIEIRQGFAETFYNVVEFTRKFPEITAAILNSVKTEDPKWNVYCPFPGECNYFPCQGLRCDYTALSNGNPTYPY